jgi:hypothetical protein
MLESALSRRLVSNSTCPSIINWSQIKAPPKKYISLARG